MPKMGVCPECLKGPQLLRYIHPKTKEYICRNCCERARREEREEYTPSSKTLTNLERREITETKQYEYKFSITINIKSLGSKALLRLIREYEMNTLKMPISLLVNLPNLRNERVRRLAGGKRVGGIIKSKYSNSTFPETKVVLPRDEKAAVKEETSFITTEAKKEKRLPLDELEQRILRAKGKKTSEIAEELGAPLGQVERRMESSIPIKYGVVGFREAKEIFDKEMARTAT